MLNVSSGHYVERQFELNQLMSCFKRSLLFEALTDRAIGWQRMPPDSSEVDGV